MPLSTMKRSAIACIAALGFAGVLAVPIAAEAARQAPVQPQAKYFPLTGRELGKKFHPLAGSGKFLPIPGRAVAVSRFVATQKAPVAEPRASLQQPLDPHTQSQLDQGDDDLSDGSRSSKPVVAKIPPSVPAPSLSRLGAKASVRPATLPPESQAQAIYELFLAEDHPAGNPRALR